MRIKKICSVLWMVIWLAIAWAPNMRGQSASTGALTGTLTDSSGAVIPDATATLKSADTGQERTSTTGRDGTYRFTLLPPGKYNVKFAANGFKSIEVGSVTIAVTETP